ncbi:hypothetical protein C2E20_7736 [Micractinium conductrix]|uniref:Uncharacterized protein n=1 Tax=Micractinium conductrix TaxID=554055 RepID=A0A2P6V3J8_9CHLO|nr:hypothetical protein C2E20_7736 [Micractinium conductrix]|eukprot:PSC68660.1 hypothetical protein C2E20_7736 [Micractinium conductrix]
MESASLRPTSAPWSLPAPKRRLCAPLRAELPTPGLTLPGLCAKVGCTVDQVAGSAATSADVLSCYARRRLAQRLARTGGSSCAGCAADADAVWAYGGCAAQGDVWCLLSLAHLAAEAASHAPPRRAAPLRASSLRLLHTAAAAVHAATDAWEVWFTGGASAALGSFAVLASSGGDAGFATGQLSAVAALVTDAASEEGGAELWVLQDILTQQEQRLSLQRCAAAY